MAYRELAPPPELAHVVRCLWTRTGRGDATLVLPDACLDVIVGGGRAFVAGPDTRPVEARTARDAVLAGVRFRPGAAAAALGVPSDELRDRRVDLADLWGPAAARALEEHDDPAALAAALAPRLREAAPDAEVRAAAGLLARAPATPVPALASAVGLGERQLRRRFTAAVGYGPKTLARIVRFRVALGRVRAGESLAAAALAAGYADQAHMTRELVALGGRTPGALAA